MALRLMLEFGARRPTNVGQIFFFVDAVVVVVGVSQKETARRSLARFLFLSASQVVGEKKETGRRSVVFLDFSVKRRKVVGFCR